MTKTFNILFCAQPRDIYGSFSWKKPINKIKNHYGDKINIEIEYHMWDKISDKPGALEPVQKLLPVTLSQQFDITTQIQEFWGYPVVVKFYDYDHYMNRSLNHISAKTNITIDQLYAADIDRWIAQHKSRDIALNNAKDSNFTLLTRTDIEVHPSEGFYDTMYHHFKIDFQKPWIAGKSDTHITHRIETFGLEVYGSWNVFHQDFWTAGSTTTLKSLYKNFIDKMLMHWSDDDFINKKDEVFFALKNSHNMFQQWIVKHTEEDIALVSDSPTSHLGHIMTRDKDK